MCNKEDLKTKLLNALVILTSLFGYLEWGNTNSMFLFQGEWEVLTKLVTDPASAAHPFVLLPLAGQVLLIVTLFQKQPGKWLTIFGVGAIGILLFFMFIIGIISFNPRIFGSTLPFVVVSILTIVNIWKVKSRVN